ncbi:MAG: hypothetical protein QY311_02010 [Candidatus Paceibacterota bacterium]|nr:MAG: hypothetical protein QY311_02010 [Candidatus Paceibacterota bacterium]
MSAITGRDAFPRKTIAEKDGWKLTVGYEGCLTEFVYEFGQVGDPVGWATLEGPGVHITIGRPGWWSILRGARLGECARFGLNLKNAVAVPEIGAALRNRYNKEPNYRFLHVLAQEAFAPYR